MNELILKLTPTIPPPPNYPYVNSITSTGNSEVGWITQQIEEAFIHMGEWIKDGFLWVCEKVFGVIDPVVGWGTRFIIIACVIIFINTGDKKYVSAGLKWGIIFLMYCYIKGAVS